MKKKKFTVMLATLVTLMICCFAAFGTVQAQAKTYRYCGSLLPKSTVTGSSASSYKPSGYIYKSKLTSKKITLYGRMVRYNGASGSKGKKYITGKKTFKLAKNVKCDGVGGETYFRYTLAQTRACLKRLNGLYFVVYVKNGKVTRLRFCS